MKRKLLSVLLSTLLLLGTLPLSASAAEAVSYLTWDDTAKRLVEKTGGEACSDYTTVTDGLTAWGEAGKDKWYVVQGNVTISSRITVTGNVHLILTDGCKLIAEGTDSDGGIQVQDNDSDVENVSTNSLTIYAQGTNQETMGSLSAKGGNNQAGIGGGDGNGGTGGNITINGGSVTAQGGWIGAGIGGGYNGAGGNITINGGTIIATAPASNNDPAAIGGGGGRHAGGDAGEIVINGGNITATGSQKGIGSGAHVQRGNIIINGGIVTANGIGTGGYNASAATTINGGIVFCTDTLYGGIHKGNQASWSGIIFEGNNGKVYGNQTLTENFEIPEEKTLEIEDGKPLTVANGVTLTNSGGLVINGTLTIDGTLTINGTFTNNGSITGTGKITPEDKKLAAAITNIVVTPETYNGSPANVTYDSTGDGKKTVTWYADNDGVAGDPLSSSAPTDAGVYHVGISAAMGKFYKAVAKVTQQFTIAQAETATPNITINYEAETLTEFEEDGNYTVNSSSVGLTNENTLAIDEAWLDTTVSIVRKAADSNHKDSETQELAIPARPDAPTGTAACSIDTGTEQITISEGYEVNTASDFGSGTAVDNGAKIAPGATLYARKAATDSDFKSKAQTITAPSRGTAPAVEINYTNETLNTTTAMQYQIVTSGQTVPSWQDCAATMAATAFDWDGTAAVAVQFRTKATGSDYASNPQETLTIPVRPAAPNLPVEKSKTHNSVTLETIAPNDNGAAAQYSKDGGANWQDSPEFTGLTASTTYSFAARYAATENSVASPASALVEITTSAAPSGGGGSYTPPSYKPEVEQPSEGGEVAVTPARPERGDQVTVTTKPEDGYQVDKIIVTDKDGKPVEVKDNGDGTFSFTQPTGKVKIEVTYKLTETKWVNPFTDVPEGAWYYESVAYVVEKGLFNGTSETKFSPNATMTRAMLMIVLARADGQDTTAPEGGKWYDTGVKWAVEQGISDGTDPDCDMTREQLATMLYRYAGSPAASNLVLDFTDAHKVSDYAQNALRWAVEQGIVTGKGGGILDPKGNATRAEVAAVLMRFLSNTAN